VRVLLTGDTHGRPLPAALLAAAAEADLVLHTGDAVDGAALALLGVRAPVQAVAGNCDPPELRLPDCRRIDLAGHPVGLTHGHLGRGRTTADRALGAFPRGSVSAVIFGHSHASLAETRDGVLLVNPGSPTTRRGSAPLGFAWLRAEPATPLEVVLVPLP
jgi:putative phosphoesterase